MFLVVTVQRTSGKTQDLTFKWPIIHLVTPESLFSCVWEFPRSRRAWHWAVGRGMSLGTVHW